MNRCVFPAVTWLACALLADAAELPQKRLSDLLQIPPIIEHAVGDPLVEVRTAPGIGASPRITIRRPALKPAKSPKIESIRVEVSKPSVGYASALAKSVLEHVWDRHVEPIETDEDSLPLIPMTKQRFVEVGTGQMTRHPVRDQVGNAWWKVRMDAPLTPDHGHHLIVMTAKSPAEFYSHFALGLRKNGSDGARRDDWVLDPRAPWLKDTHPTMLDWFNFDNSMIMTVEISHLSDWLYTQTAYRGYGVTMQFTPATEEYVTLMKAAGRSEDLRSVNLGPFKPLRHNCATHGQQLMEALLPLGDKLCGPHPLADLPKRLLRKSGRQFGEVITVEIPPQPAPAGVVQSQNSTLHTCPNPALIPEVRQLRQVPEIN